MLIQLPDCELLGRSVHKRTFCGVGASAEVNLKQYKVPATSQQWVKSANQTGHNETKV